METNNHVDQKQQQLINELERIEAINGELKPTIEQNNQKYRKLQTECNALKAEVEVLKGDSGENDQARKEYLTQLKTFNDFKFLRKKNGTQLTQRVAQINLGGANGQLWADRSLSSNFLHGFLTCVMNFDTPSWNQIQHGFDNRGGTGTNGSTLVAVNWNDATDLLDQIDVDSGFLVVHNNNYYHHADTNHTTVRSLGSNAPNENSAEYIDRWWRRYKQYYRKNVAVGTSSDIKAKAEVVMPAWVPCRNVLNHITSNKHDTTGSADPVLFGTNIFIPYYQQAKVSGTTYNNTNWIDIKLNKLRDFMAFVFPSTGNNEFLAKTGNNDYRLTNGINTYTLLDKDYSRIGLFPLYELDDNQQKSFTIDQGLDTGSVNHEWKIKDGTTDKWIRKRTAKDLASLGFNSTKFDGLVYVFNQMFGNASSQANLWINERANETNLDQVASFKGLISGLYAFAKDKLVNDSCLIPHREPDSNELAKKQIELDTKEFELEEAKKEYEKNLAEQKYYAKQITQLKKELSIFTKKDKNYLYGKLRLVHNKMEVKWDDTAKKWNPKISQKQTWEFWSDFSTNYNDYLELLGTDESQWDTKEKELINTHLKPGTHKYFKEVIEVNYNKYTTNYHTYITSKTSKNKTPEQFFEEWLKDEKNSKHAEKIVKDLEELKNYINIDSEDLGNILKKISESNLIRTDLENALKRVLGTDYTSVIKAKWAKTNYNANGKFWGLVKDFYLKTDQDWKDHIKANQGVHNNLKDWLKDNDLDVEQFIACIHLYQIKRYVNSSPDSRKEQREKYGPEIMNWFIEVDKLGYSYHDIVNSHNSDFTASKAYEELKKKLMGSIDEALGLDKSKDSETINQWLNFKEYSTQEKIEELFKDLYEEAPETKEGDKPTKKIKTEFLTFVNKGTLQEFLKEKTPQEVVATVKRYELKDITEAGISEEPKDEASKKAITSKLEKVIKSLETIEAVGQALTQEEIKTKTLATARLAHLANLKDGEKNEPTKDTPASKEMEIKGKDNENQENTQAPEKGHFGKYWKWYALGGVGAVIAILAVGYFFMDWFKGKDEENESESPNEEE